jgi:hypothetical protein
MADALAAAHLKGIVHRDLKPENVYICSDLRLKILDFGLAKLIQPDLGGVFSADSSTPRRETQPGMVVGTLGYMSPEQLRSESVDQRADLFSFGVILYEMLTGNAPFTRSTPADTMTAILRDNPVQMGATVPKPLESVVWRCLAKELRPRFQSADEIAAVLRTISASAELFAVQSSATAVPGGPIAADARPYVSRPYDETVMDLPRQSSFTILFRGPVQSGKSTSLALLERRAHEMGVGTAWIDPQPALSTVGSDEHVEAQSAAAAAELLEASWGLNRSKDRPIDSIPKLWWWLTQELAPTASHARLLILDDLAVLGAAVAEKWLVSFVRALLNQRATRALNINIAVGLTEIYSRHPTDGLMQPSSVVHWSHTVDTDWFAESDVATLINSCLLDSVITPSDLSIFRGQPYLTHAAAIDPAFRDAVWNWMTSRDEVSAGTVRKSKWYRRHRTAIQIALFGPTHEPTSNVRRLLTALVNAWANDAVETSTFFDPHQHSYLTKLRIIDMHGQPQLPIYRLIIEDLASKLDKSR